MCCQSNGEATANLNLGRDLISNSAEINQMEKKMASNAPGREIMGG